jgi:hypothetical protein
MTRSRKPAVPAASPVSSAAATDDIVQVKVWLLGISPMVWRRVLIPANFSLRELHVDYPNLRKLARFAHEFAVYITSNVGSLINYGERYRAGERISSCLAESTVNAVISKRFAKRQQMQWTPCGAHLLLQTRTRALDAALRPLFER